ncbi:MAG: ABC transporter ATP-binding protein [Propionibacteriaceae bacterium]|jgi:putative ABC transport system ATP-binding protein|nr:ABC transporter ATP-binding protein [Propionibacteriaceae bacterium]
MISLTDVGKVYRGRNFEVEALRNVDLQVPMGQFLSIVGKSGSGKSSLLKIIGLLDFDHTGEYLFHGLRYGGAKDSFVTSARKNIGYVFQDFQLIRRYTLRKNLRIAAAIRKGSPVDEEVDLCLERVGIADKALSYPDELSGGQKQRASVARAIIGQPRLIIADEPTGSLDSSTAQQIVTLLRQVHDDLQCCLLLVTHDSDIAMTADRVVKLVAGEVRHDILY